jgi:hypothetical protein
VRSDGAVLPDLVETVVLHQLGLVRSDDLPGIAARWLASDVIDTQSVRLLAGHDPHDPWMLEQLLADAVSEARVEVPGDVATVQHIAVDWVTMTWRESGDTRWAVSTLARLGETEPAFDLGPFIGLDDEWNGSWGRLKPDLQSAARHELERLLHGAIARMQVQRTDMPLCVGLGKIASWNVVGSRMFIAVTAAFGGVACSVGGSTCGALGRWCAGRPEPEA